MHFPVNLFTSDIVWRAHEVKPKRRKKNKNKKNDIQPNSIQIYIYWKNENWMWMRRRWWWWQTLYTHQSKYTQIASAYCSSRWRENFSHNKTKQNEKKNSVETIQAETIEKRGFSSSTSAANIFSWISEI